MISASDALALTQTEPSDIEIKIRDACRLGQRSVTIFDHKKDLKHKDVDFEKLGYTVKTSKTHRDLPCLILSW
jgi:hypothetical protein